MVGIFLFRIRKINQACNNNKISEKEIIIQRGSLVLLAFVS